MLNIFRKILSLFKARKIYKLEDVFGCSECPPEDCPTFLERSVHTKFTNALRAYNIIIVFGESRQGKTWTIEKYCPNQKRISCFGTTNIEQIKKDMLHAVGLEVRHIEHSVTEESGIKGSVSTSVGQEMLARAGASLSASTARTETLSTSYDTVDMSRDTVFLDALSNVSRNVYFVLDNFHYLSTETQQEFCSFLKELNYRGIKIIIIGVWKDASRITALAPDLLTAVNILILVHGTQKTLKKSCRWANQL